MLRLTRKGADPTPSNVAALYGMGGRVVIALGETGGQVKLANGETWTARLDHWAGGDPIEVGSTVTVTAISGSTAIVAPNGRSVQP
jgi:membrane protein implicated in regulation of membrane protease activity